MRCVLPLGFGHVISTQSILAASHPEHLARIVRRQIAPAVILQPRPHNAAGRPADSRADRVPIAAYALRVSGRASGCRGAD